MRTRIAVFIAIIQTILIAGHAAIYETWIDFWGTPGGEARVWMKVAVAALAVSFVAATMIGFRYSNWAVRAFYRLAAGWLGFLSFLFFASCVCWIAGGALHLAGVRGADRALVATLFGAATAAGVYGIVNAARTRVVRVSVKLENLPESWRGRTAAVVSDLHLGHVRGYGFARKIVRMVSGLRADVVFIAGDMYDGVAGDYARLAAPWKECRAPLGVFFAAGNHEEFSNPQKYFDAVESAGVRVLNNEKVAVDGMQVAGVDYRASIDAEIFAEVLRRMEIDPGRASILVSHAPHRLPVAERAGVSLQVSGHTHGGQLAPFTWMVRRIFGAYAYGLHSFRKMMVYTSCGAGTWGPPMRVGTNPEIALITFE